MSSRRRLARGSVAAAFSTWVALTFHLLGGGGLPAIAGVVIPFVLSWCACVVLAAWRGDALRLTASVLLSQGLFHTLFTLGATGGARGGHHGMTVDLGATDVAGAATWSHMWLAHAVAAAITVIGLRSGETALARISRAVLDAARGLCIGPVTEPSGLAVATAPAQPRAVMVRPDLGRFHRDIRRRGPPVCV